MRDFKYETGTKGDYGVTIHRTGYTIRIPPFRRETNPRLRGVPGDAYGVVYGPVRAVSEAPNSLQDHGLDMSKQRRKRILALVLSLWLVLSSLAYAFAL